VCADWSAARANTLLALKAEGVEWREILAAVNELPGNPVRTIEAVYQKYTRLCRKNGLKKEPLKKWTVARVEKLLALKTAKVTYGNMLPLLNALPGLPISTAESVKHKFLELHHGFEAKRAMFPHPRMTSADTVPGDGAGVSSLNSPPVHRSPAAAFSGLGYVEVPYEVVKQYAVRERLCGRKNAPNLHVINQYRQARGQAPLMIAGAL
jgi:hypothetical protein